MGVAGIGCYDEWFVWSLETNCVQLLITVAKAISVLMSLPHFLNVYWPDIVLLHSSRINHKWRYTSITRMTRGTGIQTEDLCACMLN